QFDRGSRLGQLLHHRLGVSMSAAAAAASTSTTSACHVGFLAWDSAFVGGALATMLLGMACMKSIAAEAAPTGFVSGSCRASSHRLAGLLRCLGRGGLGGGAVTGRCLHRRHGTTTVLDAHDLVAPAQVPHRRADD